MAQLAAMGVAIPEEYRTDVAMAGDWQTVSRKSAAKEVKSEGKNVMLTSAEKKRKMKDREEQEDEQEEEVLANRRGWGRALKKFPTDRMGGTQDLDSLLGGPIMLKKEEVDSEKHNDEVKGEKEEKEQTTQDIKDESIESLQEQKPSVMEAKSSQPPEPSEPPVMFKKRKAKPIK